MNEDYTILDIDEILSAISEVVHLYGVADPTGTPRDVRLPVALFQLLANLSTDVETDKASDTKYPSVKAVYDYVVNTVAGLWDDRGNYDASGNIFPSTGGSGTGGIILKGDIWTASDAGILGGENVEIGDTIRALVDSPGQTASNWSILQRNLDYVTQGEVELASPTENSKITTILRVFQGFLYWLANTTISALNTTSKNIIGAINELYASIGISDTPQAWSSTIQFDGNYGSFNTNAHTQTAQIDFAVSFTSGIFGAVTHRIIVSNGDDFTFPAGYITINTDGATGTKAINTFTPVADKQYRIIFECVDVSNSKYNVIIVDFETTSQLNTPVLSSATLDSGLDIDVVYTDTNSYPPEVQIEIEADTVNTFDSGSEFSNFAAKDSLTDKITCLAYSTLYYFRVRAVGDGINTQTSDWSNIESATTGSAPSIIVESDDFTGSTIDTGKWTEIDPDAVITQNNALIFTAPGSNVSNRTDYLQGLNADTTITCIQVTIAGVGSSSNDANWWVGLWADSSGDNEIIIIGSATNRSIARLIIRQGGAVIYDFISAVSINNTWKIFKNSNDNIQFFYLSAPDTWTQVGGTTNQAFGATLYPVLSAANGLNGTTVTVDDFYQTNANYSTSIPS